MSMKEQREAARLYKEKAGTAAEIGRMYGVHYSTIYDILDRFNVERHVPAASVSHSASMKKYWAERKSEEIKAGAGRAVYSPDLRDQYLVAEAPAPVQKQDGVDIDAIHVKPRRKTTRKKKSWWQRVKDKLFKR